MRSRLGIHLMALTGAWIAICSVVSASNYQPGWPMQLWGLSNKPNIANIDSDPEPELIFATSGGIYVFDANGNLEPPWPFVDGWGAVGFPLVGDIEGDGVADIVYQTSNSHRWGAVSATGQPKAGWPVLIWDTFLSIQQPFSLADLDQDGDDELILFGSDTDFDNRLIHAIRGDGTPLPGWPVEIPYVVGPSDESYVVDFSVGDVEFDGSPEVAVGGYLSDNGFWLPSPVFLFEADGSVPPGWPVTPVLGSPSQLQFIRPILADLSGNMSCEVFGCGFSDLHCYSADGQLLTPPYGLGVASRPTACGDLDGDGSLEIVTGGMYLRTFDSEGHLIAQNGPTGHWIFDGITIGDVDGDGCQEICAVSLRHGADYWNATAELHLHLFDQDLVPLSGWPKLLPGTPTSGTGLFATALGDLDLDNDLEVITCHYETVHVFDQPNTTGGPVSTEWPLFGHDSKRSGYYHQGSTWELRYIPGDASGDGILDLADPIRILGYLAGAWSPTNCTAARDFDESGTVDFADPIALLGYLFAGQAAPAGAGECHIFAPGAPLQCSRHECP